MNGQRSVPWEWEPMARTIKALLLGIALFLVTPSVSLAADCQFVLGFKLLRDLIGHDIVGECLDNEHYNAIGDSNQHTTGGLLAWRKADNWTAFTDGYRTWVNGPNGLQQRLNTERFEWEADYGSGGGIATPTPSPDLMSTPLLRPPISDSKLAHAAEVMRSTPSGETAYQILSLYQVDVVFGPNHTFGWLLFEPANNRIVVYGKFHLDPPEVLAAFIARGTALAKWYFELGEPTTLEQCIEREYLAISALDTWNLEKLGSRGKHSVGNTNSERYERARRDVTFRIGQPLDYELNDPILCPAVPRISVDSEPTPVLTAAPTPTPVPVRFVDPLLQEAFRVMRSTEFGEIIYHAYQASDVNYIAFAHLERHGVSQAKGLFEPWNNRVLLDESLRDESQYVRVAWLVHELMHAWRHADDHLVSTPEQCFEDETLAFRAQARWWYEKFGRNGKRNPAGIEQSENSRLALWLAGRIGEMVRRSDFYQEHCANYED